MGRRKIDIEFINDDRVRNTTFTKRRAGLFKKAYELSILCGLDISVVIIGRNHKIYEFSSNDPNETLNQFQQNPRDVVESKRPGNYGKHLMESRILDQNSLNNKGLNQSHSHSNSNISIPRIQLNNTSTFKNHTRTKSDIFMNSQTKTGLNHTSDEDEDEDEDEEEDDEDNEQDDDHRKDTVHEYERSKNNIINDTTISMNNESSSIFDMNNKRRISDSARLMESNKRSRMNSNSSLPVNGPNTPESHMRPFNNGNSASSSAAVTPYRTTNNIHRKNSKGKDRPTLSIKIPTRDSISNPSTITAAVSSNKSSKESNDSNNNISTNKNSNEKDDLKIDNNIKKELMSASFSGSLYTSTDTSGLTNNASNSSKSKYQLSGLPSALFKEKKNIANTPLTNMLNSLHNINPNNGPTSGPNSGLASLNQIYINNYSMSPTIYSPYPNLPNNTATAITATNNNDSSNGSNNINTHAYANSQINANHAAHNSNNTFTNNPAITSIYNVNGITNNNIPLPSISNSTVPLPQTPGQSFFPRISSATQSQFPQLRKPGSSSNIITTTNNMNLKSNMTLPNLAETPILGNGEFSSLPSKFADGLSPGALFNGDWQLSGSTPISAFPPPLSGMNGSSASSSASGNANIGIAGQKTANTTASSYGACDPNAKENDIKKEPET